MFKQIPAKDTSNIIDVGGGYGRFSNLYNQYFKGCVLLDPSDKLLKKAKQKNINLSLVKGEAEDIPFPNGYFDVALLIRVAHHLQNFAVAIEEIQRVLKPGGYFILEFPNKIHLKGRLMSLFGLREVLFDLSPIDRRSQKEIEQGTVPFYNYHPYWVLRILESRGWEKIDKLSVSNFRHPIFKALLSDKSLLYLEKKVQQPFSLLNLGPSIFLLLKKRA